MANRTGPALRPNDPDNELDWSGYWYRRAFGRTVFTFREIMDGGRDFRLEWERLMTLYYEYMWDQDTEKRRELQTSRGTAAQHAIDWVGRHYDIMLERFSEGEDLSDYAVDFDSRANWAPDQRRR